MTIIILITAAIDITATYYTNTNYIYDMTGRDNAVYCATNGGIAAFNTITGEFAVLTNTDGLQTNAQNCVGLDSSGSIWTGSDLGLALIASDLSAVHLYPVECLTSTRITDIACRKDSVYVGSSNGLLFIDTKGTPADFSDDTQIKIFEQLPCNSIRSIAVDDTSVWVGTATGGIAHFSKNMTLTATYTMSHGLLSNEINKLAIIDSHLYVASGLGLNRFVNDHFDTLLTGYAVNDISRLGDTLVLGLDPSLQVGTFHDGSLTVIKNGLPNYSRVMCLLNLGGELLCGLGNRYATSYYGDGIGRYEAAAGQWTVTKNRGLPSNHIAEITANEHGVFIAHGQRTSASESRGLGWLNNENEWLSFSTDSVLWSNYVHRVTTDPQGRVWLGFNTFPNQDSSIMLSCLDPRDKTWFSLYNRYNGMEGTEAVWDIEFDREGNMYLSLARPTNKVWLMDPALEQVYYLNPQLTDLRYQVEIALDSTGRIWQTHPDAGLSMTDTRNTLFDRSDDIYRNYTTADGLISNYMRGCIVDRDNTLYACTDQGLVVRDSVGFSNRTDISDSELLDGVIDSQGRIWLLARDGIHSLDPVANTILHWRFRDHNIDISFIESIAEMTQVQGFEFDPVRRCFWVGGETGLLKLAIEYDPLMQLAAKIYPNPVTGNTVRIKDLPADARVDIYTISGRRVARDLAPDSVFGEVVWQIPQGVASGMYFALVRSGQGNHTYKFAIVR
ncbi:T9SS type A sorting domain-containing protein [candidate division WOR-3 bacterium]|nr:T9SS type A sorting domain-containing protein [candidate division WOR-3 bacterium]